MRIISRLKTKSIKTIFASIISMLLAFTLLASPAFAAPIWLERNFVQSSSLLDPVFESHNSDSVVKIDHTQWDQFLKRYVKIGNGENTDGVNLVNYRGVSADDKNGLQSYIQQLSDVDIRQLNRDEQLSFWINLYNALTVDLIIENYPLASIRDLDKPWDSPVVTIAGIALTLNNIEHGIIRPVWGDNRIHYAVNCASIGCPNLSIDAYTGDNVEQLLDKGARDYINHPRGVGFTKRRGRVIASKIYGWYNGDFGTKEREILNHIRQYANDDLLKKLDGKKSISKYEYDWTLNDAAPVENVE